MGLFELVQKRYLQDINGPGALPGADWPAPRWVGRFLYLPTQSDGYMLWQSVIWWRFGPLFFCQRNALTCPGRRWFFSARRAVEWGFEV